MYFPRNGWYHGEPNKRTAKRLEKSGMSDRFWIWISTFGFLGPLLFWVMSLGHGNTDKENLITGLVLTVLGALWPTYLMIAHRACPVLLGPLLEADEVRLKYLTDATKLELKTLSHDQVCRTIVNQYLDDTHVLAMRIKLDVEARDGDDQLMGFEERQLRAELRTAAEQAAKWAQAEIDMIHCGVYGRSEQLELPL